MEQLNDLNYHSEPEFSVLFSEKNV